MLLIFIAETVISVHAQLRMVVLSDVVCTQDDGLFLGTAYFLGSE
jgi:hypothetical protein